jgi:hypothetical protein
MDNPTKLIIADILDNAIASQGELIFQRLIAGATPEERDSRVVNARNSVDLLRKGGMPAYDDAMVALFYAIQYQLSHINLVYSMICDTVQRRNLRGNHLLTDMGALHVVDYGCGALTMRFGVIFAVADALQRGETIREVRIDSLDPNVPIVQLGVDVWNAFVHLVQTRAEGRLNWMRMAIDAMDNARPGVYLRVPLNAIQRIHDADAWLSAIHVVYGGPQSNENEVRENLAFLNESIEPVIGFLTSDDSKLQIMRGVSPFTNGYQSLPCRPLSQFTNNIPTHQTTSKLHNWGFRPPSWRVFWGWSPGTVMRAYERQRQ